MEYQYSAEMQSFAFFSLVLASILAIPSLAVTLTDVSQLETLAYDFIIVGGVHANQDSFKSEGPSLTIVGQLEMQGSSSQTV
jgi:hypothetical protein